MLDSGLPLRHEIKILAVDDNRKNIQQMETFFHGQGDQVVPATNGEEGRSPRGERDGLAGSGRFPCFC